MKKHLLLLFGALIALPSPARDFEYTYQGQTLTYTVIDETAKTCETKQGTGWYSEGNSVSGSLVLPSTVSDGSSSYSLVRIGNYSFAGCKELSSAVIPNTVTSIEEGAFYDCISLTSMTIPNSVTEIGDNAFLGCWDMTSISIGNSVTSIGSGAFFLCEGLTSIIIPNSVTSIGEEAFYNCHGLTSIIIGSSVTEIGKYAFYGCESLKKSAYPNTLSAPFDTYDYYNVVIAYDPEDAIIEDGFIYGKEKSAIYFAPLNIEGEYVIPGSVTKIGARAFRWCTDMTSVTIPNSVTSIGWNAFAGCTGLTGTLTIPNSVTDLGDEAFSSCEGLTEIKIGTSVTSIGDWTFSYCTGLASIVIPNSVTKIGDYAFRDCSCLTSVTIPNSVTVIGMSAFADCIGLTSIDIPDSVTQIGSYAFSYCSGLTSLSIGNSVTSIGTGAFNGCSGLVSVIIPGSVSELGEWTFSGCRGLKKSAYPNTLSNPFGSDCVSIAYNPEGAIIEDGFIYGKEKSAIYFAPLDIEGEYVIPGYVTEIGESAFRDCSGLTSVTIPNSVTSIGWYAFNACSGLTAVTIPNSVVEIGYDAFYKCNGLLEVTYLAEDPINPHVKSLFDSEVYEKATLYYLKSAEEKIASTEPWCNFVNRIGRDADFNAISEVSAEGEGAVEVFNLNGVKVGESTEGLPRGIYLIRRGSQTRKFAI